MELGRPTEMFASAPGVIPVMFNSGHFLLDKNSMGYCLEEQASNGSGTHQHTSRMTARQMEHTINKVSDMAFLGKTISLRGISQKGKNRTRENPDSWDVLAESDRVLFKPNETGPWLFITPRGCDQNHKAARWIRAQGDPDFQIVE